MTTFNSGFGHGFEYAYFIGIYVAPLLMGVALWRSRAVPRWLAVLFFAGLEVAQQQISSGPVVVLYMLPFAAAMVLLAARIWQAAAESQPAATGARQRTRVTAFKGVPAGYPPASPAPRSFSLPDCSTVASILHRPRDSPRQTASIESASGRPRDDLLNGQRFEIVVFRLPWRAAAVAARRVAVA